MQVILCILRALSLWALMREEQTKKFRILDIVIVTSNMIANQDFTQKFGEVYKQQTEYYGTCTSIRVWYKDGKEVEFGIV